MRLVKILGFTAVLVVFGWGIFNLTKEKLSLASKLDELTVKFEAIQKENKDLTGKIEYFKLPENLLKEVKSQFNYREAGEKLIIVVPNAATSTH